MNKHIIEWHGHKYYFIGVNEYGRKAYYQESTFDCDWYWGIGYIETFTNNKNPELSRDIECHTHWDYLFDEKAKERIYHTDAFKAIFPENPFTDKEQWKILELMKALYTARKYSDMLHRGGSCIAENPCKDLIKNNKEYTRINEKVIPALLEKLYSILEGVE